MYEDSITYGVNAVSPLNDIDNFHVVNQLPQDIMHILLEGVIPYELVQMLICFVVNRKYFTIDQLNDRIRCFAYSNQEAKDKPSPIKAQVVSLRGARLSQSCELDTFIHAQYCITFSVCLYSCTDVEPCN